MPSVYVYILECSDGSYYVGQTDNLARRISEHELGEGSDWTARRRPVTLVWSQRYPDRRQALRCEASLKGWSRAKKEAVTRGEWQALKALAKKVDWEGYHGRQQARTEAPGDPTTPCPE